MADLSQIPTDQLLAMAQAQQGGASAPTDLSKIPTDQLLAMAQNHPQAQNDPSFLGQLGHQLGLAGRYAIEGPANAIGMVTDPFGQFLPGYQKTGDLAASAADALGLPKPQTPLEKTIGGASKALTGTAATMGAGAAANATELLAQPAMQAFSSMLGGGTEAATNNPVLSAAASMLPGAPSGLTGLSRLALRGKAAGGMQNAIDAFQQAGTQPSAGQAAQGGVASTLESILAKLPGSSGVMGRNRAGQAEDVGNKVTGMADQLSAGSDPVAAGAAINEGIRGEGGFVDRFKQQKSDLYDVVDKHVPPSTPVPVSATQQYLNAATTPIKGAEATSGMLSNPKLKAIADAVGIDTQNSQLPTVGSTLPAGAVKFGPDGKPVLGDGGTLPYEAVKALRTKVGDMIADAGIISDVPKAQLKQLYGALSTDMRTATNAISPEAAAANNTAENFYRNGIKQIDNIESVVQQNGGPEAIFRAATSGTKDGATTLANVVNTLKPEEAQVVTSAVVRRMGKATSGNQNDAGDVFSPQTFLTSWNNMSPQAKQILFDRMPGTFRSDMDKVAQTASLMKDAAKVGANPSGSGAAVTNTSTATAFALAVITGHFPAAGAIALGVGANNRAAALMTNPTFVKWLARNSTAPIGVLPAQIGYLSQLGQKQNDPDLTQAAQLIGSSLGQTGQ